MVGRYVIDVVFATEVTVDRAGLTAKAEYTEVGVLRGGIVSSNSAPCAITQCIIVYIYGVADNKNTNHSPPTLPIKTLSFDPHPILQTVPWHV